MDERRKPSLTAFLPQVAVATLAVAVCPSLAVWALRSAGLVHSVGVSIALGTILALAASYIGNLYWRSRAGAGDLLFSELMAWGWVRRWWIERRLASTVLLLDGVTGTEELSHERRRELLLALASALEAQDPYTHGHSRRVARHAAAIARQLGLPGPEIARVRTAAALHDVGKLDTPRSILRKPSRLTDEEFAVIKRHPVRGAAMVAALGDAELAGVVRHHHERIDGTGYPDGLAGEGIPLAARIIAVADTFDAITSSRPYRPASSHKQALAVLAVESGTQLDPAAVRAFQTFYVGRRPLAVWAVLTSMPERIVSSLSGGINVAAGSIARVAAASAVTTAAAVGAISSPLVGVTTQTLERSASLSPSVSTAIAVAAHSQVRQQLTEAPPAASAGVSGGLGTRAGAGTKRTAPVKQAGSPKKRVQAVGAHGGAPAASSTAAAAASTGVAAAQSGGSGQSSTSVAATSVSSGASNGKASGGSSSHGSGAGASHGNGTGASHGNGNGASSGNGSGATKGTGNGASNGQGNGGSNGKGNGASSGTGGSAGNGSGSSSGKGQGSSAGSGQSAGGGQGSAGQGQGSGNASSGNGKSAATAGQGSSASGTTTAASSGQANANSNGQAKTQIVPSGKGQAAGAGSAGR